MGVSSRKHHFKQIIGKKTTLFCVSQVKHHIRLLQLRLSFNKPRLSAFSPGENIARSEQRGTKGQEGACQGCALCFLSRRVLSLSPTPAPRRTPPPPERTGKRGSLSEGKVHVRTGTLSTGTGGGRNPTALHARCLLQANGGRRSPHRTAPRLRRREASFALTR